MDKKSDKHVDTDKFSLSLGGPFYQILSFVGLIRKPLLLCNRRIMIACLLTWVPLFVLAIIGGVAFGGVKVPFITDIDVHVRFLVTVSMLIYAEVIAHDRIHVIVRQFLTRNIIPEECIPKFKHSIASAMRLRDSIAAEIVIIVVVYTIGHLVSTEYLPLGVSSWFAVRENDISQLTPAGYWYVFVSLPIFQFILLRWYFRVMVWYRFLWQVSRMPLQLNSLHPDRAGGIGFLANSIYALEPFLLAHTVLLSGMIFNRILNAGAVLADFQVEMVGIICFVIIIPLVPLLFFIFKMINEKRTGTLNFGVVAKAYTLKDIAKNIKMPALIIDSEADAFMQGQAKALYDQISGPKTFLLFTRQEAAQSHCQMGATAISNELIFDWLDKTLKFSNVSKPLVALKK